MIRNTVYNNNLKSITKRHASVVMLVLVTMLCNSCFKNLPDKTVVYRNDFEKMDMSHIRISNIFGTVDSLKIVDYNGSKVLGRFNSQLVEFDVENLPDHNAVKIQFDLLIHDKWDGDHLAPGNTIPDAWKMVIDNYPVYITTFSNGPYNQSFPDNYNGSVSVNPPRSNSWAVLPGVCANAGQSNGTTLYKIEYTTSHSGPLHLMLSDVLQPFNSPCLKSWSVDNMLITAITYKY